MPSGIQPSSYRLTGVLWTALQHGRLVWRALRRGDQAVMIATLLDLARKTEHPDAFFVDGRPAAPRILVVYSTEGLQAMADALPLDKGPTTNIAVATSGDANAYEGIMGPAAGRPYARQIAMLDAIIKRSQRGLRRLVEARAREHLAPPRRFDLRQAQYFTASVILDQIFPAHAWTRDAIAETIDAIEHNNEIVGPAVQKSAMRGDDAVAVLQARGIAEAVAGYERVFEALAREERERRAALEASDDPAAAAALDELHGLPTQLAQEGLSWPDTKALMNTFFAASYETVSTTITEWVYQVTRHPELWRALQDAQGEDRRQRIQASLYESVRLITPVPILLRRAEQDCSLVIEADDGERRTLEISRGQLMIGLNAAPLRDPARFPRPEAMRLQLSPEQRNTIRLAWGLKASESAEGPDRFCQGFAYSVALMAATIDYLLGDCEQPDLLADSPIQMFGTQARRSFVAQLQPRA